MNGYQLSKFRKRAQTLALKAKALREDLYEAGASAKLMIDVDNARAAAWFLQRSLDAAKSSGDVEDAE